VLPLLAFCVVLRSLRAARGRLAPVAGGLLVSAFWPRSGRASGRASPPCSARLAPRPPLAAGAFPPLPPGVRPCFLVGSRLNLTGLHTPRLFRWGGLWAALFWRGGAPLVGGGGGLARPGRPAGRPSAPGPAVGRGPALPRSCWRRGLGSCFGGLGCWGPSLGVQLGSVFGGPAGVRLWGSIKGVRPAYGRRTKKAPYRA